MTITVSVISPTKTVKRTDYLHKSIVDDSSEKVKSVDIVVFLKLLRHLIHLRLVI